MISFSAVVVIMPAVSVLVNDGCEFIWRGTAGDPPPQLKSGVTLGPLKLGTKGSPCPAAFRLPSVPFLGGLLSILFPAPVQPPLRVAPKDRPVAMVFQNHALYPHLTVRENLASGLVWRKFSRSEIEQHVRKVAILLA